MQIALRRPELRPPLVVGIGGSAREGSSTNIALLTALRHAETAGAITRFFGGQTLATLPLYDPQIATRTTAQEEIVEAVRAAQGVIFAAPAYHGNVSGLVKNAIDLLEDLRDDPRPYLDGRSVGCIVTGAGWQACGATLNALRGSVHALRGWPTPLGVTLDMSTSPFSSTATCSDPKLEAQLSILGRQVVEFAVGRRLYEQAL
jgi:FMN reductase